MKIYTIPKSHYIIDVNRTRSCNYGDGVPLFLDMNMGGETFDVC